ncbi:MAG: multicopper oxidase domain-containing protein [Gammaproteobacteria bacterium]|nr:multicopper oxidase domain-containing protein [Gammaproteobacteria bacterium]
MKKAKWNRLALYFVVISQVLIMQNCFAIQRIINLTVSYKTVYFGGVAKTAIAINNQIPGPVLHLTEGDQVTINVINHLNEETAVHWHGILLPWQMDGVLGITQHGIQPGKIFHYQFTPLQSGTYWYHAHAGLQEQLGLYGALIIDPKVKPSYHYTKDYPIVLSDWSNTHPNQILANLKKEGDYYGPNFPLQPSLFKFIHDYRNASAVDRVALKDDYKMMQQMRMSIYDMSDVAYDAFLLNGHPKSHPWMGRVKVGDIVRLRFIGAGASTLFHVKIPGTVMQVVQVQGNNVKPYAVDDFTIAPGETYDVLVKIEKNDPYVIYAESQDTVGAAWGALLPDAHQLINEKRVTPFPEPLPVTRQMMSIMMGDMSTKMDMSSMNMAMPTEPSVHGDRSSSFHTADNDKTFGTKYQNLVAATKTNDPDKSVTQVIRMELFGYMDRYIWFINGVPEYNAKPIALLPGKRYRFIFTNPSMMHHPMHMHGHWFILRNGHGSHDPLLHTIDIPPGATVTADVDTDASGQWLFHCHLLYHMMSGMARVFQYTTLIEIIHDQAKPQHVLKNTALNNRPIVRVDELRPIDVAFVHHPMAHQMGIFLANFLDVGEDPYHDAQKLTFKGLYGRDFNKLELYANDAEMDKGTVQNADLDIFYWHLLDQFWAVKGGVNYFYRPAKTPYWQPGFGIEGLMPYFIDTNVRTYFYSGSLKLDVELSRDSQITNNFFIRTGVRSILASKTVTRADIGSGLNQMRYIIRPYYRLMPGLNLFAEYEHEQDYGRFKQLEAGTHSTASQNTMTLGISMVF